MPAAPRGPWCVLECAKTSAMDREPCPPAEATTPRCDPSPAFARCRGDLPPARPQRRRRCRRWVKSSRLPSRQLDASCQPSIDANHLTGDVSGFIADQEAHERCDFFGFAEPAHRDMLNYLVDRAVLNHVRFDQAG